MNIACLAWGSLLWKAQPLHLKGDWQPGGPSLPIEFARIGDNGELATVICPNAPTHRVWWAELTTDDLGDACEQLREHEQIDASQPEFVGSVRDDAYPDARPEAAAIAYAHAAEIAAWAARTGFGAVVWTALPPRYAGTNGRIPAVQEALSYLRGLEGQRLAHAEDYIRRVPNDIRTPYRDAIEAALGWTPH